MPTAISTRTTTNEKLATLGHGREPRTILERLKAFTALFVFRKSGGIVTISGQGPRAWTALRVPLEEKHVMRHLLADQMPGLNPVWFGSRSFSTTKFVCIDVDADRSNPASPVFQARCEEVEQALRRLGINPANPFHLRIQPTPSGGRHYIFFLDRAYHLEQIHPILNAAGLNHRKGHTELFPSPTQGLRLPFGYIPGKPHDPEAWIEFIDDYRSGNIFRFSLVTLHERLGNHEHRWEQQRQSLQATSQPTPLGIPKRQRLAPTPSNATSEARYDQLLTKKITRPAEARELMALGIRRDGTRTQVLKILAAHLIWVRGMKATHATEVLTAWAMNREHESKDIRADLENGTTHVATHIARICKWYEDHRQSTPRQSRPETNTTSNVHSNADRSDHPDLRLRSFTEMLVKHAKSYGMPQPDGSYLVAIPINSVVRKWPGCSAHQYKPKMDAAIAAGILELHQEKWHNRRGTGRARIYRVIIAHAHATSESANEPCTALSTKPNPEQVITDSVPPTRNANHAETNNNAEGQCRRIGPKPSTPVPEACALGNLGTATHRSDPTRHDHHRPCAELSEDCRTNNPTVPIAKGRRLKAFSGIVRSDGRIAARLPKCTRTVQHACQVDKAQPTGTPRNKLPEKYAKLMHFRSPPNLNPPVRITANLDFENST